MKYSLLLLPLLILGLSGCQGPIGQSAHYDVDQNPKIAVKMPANAPSISQQFRRLSIKESRDHLAIDIIAPLGTPVLAADAGLVTSVRSGAAYGKRVEIQHQNDSNGQTLETRYFHLDRQTVVVGQRVARGQQIGTLGHSGLLAGTLDHLHYSVVRSRPAGLIELMDPNLYWLKGPGQIDCFDPQQTYKNVTFAATYPVQCGG